MRSEPRCVVASLSSRVTLAGLCAGAHARLVGRHALCTSGRRSCPTNEKRSLPRRAPFTRHESPFHECVVFPLPLGWEDIAGTMPCVCVSELPSTPHSLHKAVPATLRFQARAVVCERSSLRTKFWGVIEHVWNEIQTLLVGGELGLCYAPHQRLAQKMACNLTRRTRLRSASV